MSSTSESASTSDPAGAYSGSVEGDISYQTSPGTSWSSGGTLMAENVTYPADQNYGFTPYCVVPGTHLPIPAFGYGDPSSRATHFHDQNLVSYNALNNDINHGILANDWLLSQATNISTSEPDCPTTFTGSSLLENKWKEDYSQAQNTIQTRPYPFSCQRTSEKITAFEQTYKLEAETPKRSIYDITDHTSESTNTTFIDTESNPLPRANYTGDYLARSYQRLSEIARVHQQPGQGICSTRTQPQHVPYFYEEFHAQHKPSHAFVSGNELWKDPMDFGIRYITPQILHQQINDSASNIGQQQRSRDFGNRGAFLTPALPGNTDSDRQGSTFRNKSRDEFLLQCKAAGMSYKDIKTKGGFDEAESTLRGRYRTLTKPKEARVRKPGWSDADVAILKQTVAQFVTSTTRRRLTCARSPHSQSSEARLQALNKVPWKKVAECMATRGCYRYGNATVKKKYWEVMNLGQS